MTPCSGHPKSTIDHPTEELLLRHSLFFPLVGLLHFFILLRWIPATTPRLPRLIPLRNPLLLLPPPPPPPPPHSMDFSATSSPPVDFAEKLTTTIDFLSYSIDSADKSSLSSSFGLPLSSPNYGSTSSSSSLDFANKSTDKKQQKRKSVDEILNQWKDSHSTVRGGVGGTNRSRRRRQTLGEGARKGYMKGKGGPDNLECNYKGVRQRTTGKWVSEIREPEGGRLVWLGTFSTAYDAAVAFDKAALAMYGPYAKLNIPEAFNPPPEPTVNSPSDSLNSGELSDVDTELRLGFPK